MKSTFTVLLDTLVLLSKAQGVLDYYGDKMLKEYSDQEHFKDIIPYEKKCAEEITICIEDLRNVLDRYLESQYNDKVNL